MKVATTPAATPARKRKPKPEKPWPDFPLYWHPRGYWMCKRQGQEWRYTADANESHRMYQEDVKAGEPVGRTERRYLLRDAVNLYLTRQKRKFEAGELSDVQFTKCRFELERKLAKSVRLSTPLNAFRAIGAGDNGPSALFHEIRRKAIARGLQAAHRHVTIVRAALDYAAGKKLMLPPDYSDDFDPPTGARIDRERNRLDAEHGDRAWSNDELRTIIEGARVLGTERRGKRKNRIRKNPHLYAQVLLAIFAGFGSDDCSAIPEGALLRDKGVVRFPRVKNGRPRVAALPPRVWEAIEVSIAARHPPTTDKAKGLLFRTETGRKCNAAKGTSDDKGLLSPGRNDTIGQNFKRLIRKLGVHKFRAGFKTLRAMSRTLMVGAGVDPDLIAVVMGRKFRYPVDEYYVRGDLREKLFTVAKHLEDQLFPPAKRTRQRR